MKIVIVGGVAGGATALARLRRLDEQCEIILFEKGKYVSFANCGLPYYVGGIISPREALFVSDKESIEAKYGVTIRTQTEVLQINRDQKTVSVVDHLTGKKYEESYDKLLLSTGSYPFVPKAEGVDADNVFTLWTVDDVDAITAFINEHAVKKAVVVGGGFIGLEMAENLFERGIQVTLVEMASHVMPPLDGDMAKYVENHLAQKGVKLMLECGFAGTSENGKYVLLNTSEKIESDLTILSIGVRPNNSLAKDAKLNLTDRGGIKVDENLQTSDPHIYAVGDVIGVTDEILKFDTMIPLAGPANKQGRAVAANMLDLKSETYKSTMGTSVAKIFDLTVASTGANEKTLQRVGKVYKKDYFFTTIHPMSHASYYPGALPMTIKLIFEQDGKILGAQIVGYNGVDKRIDTIATAIHFKGTVQDLSELELAYAPPYSSAKDPVNFAGFVAQNILEGLTTQISYAEYKENKSHYTFLDVREDDELLAFKVEDALHFPLSSLRKDLSKLDKSKTYVVACAVGIRGYIAERILKQNGFNVCNLMGGTRSIIEAEQDISTPSAISNFHLQNTEQTKMTQENIESKIHSLNVSGLSCPGPIVQVSKTIQTLQNGEVLEVSATDPGFSRDIESWCKNTGNSLLSNLSENGKFIARIQKGECTSFEQPQVQSHSQKEKTMIIFDGDLDKAIAAFIIATGAASMGNKVHMFFTFWGLSILRKENAPKTKKDFMSKMFAAMLPKGSKKLSLSKMNFFGAGAKMIRSVMKKQGVSLLEDLIREAQELGVEMTACQMSMDVMGLKIEELIDGVKVGGVATMLDNNDASNMNLFI